MPHIFTMLKPHLREVLMHALHTGKASVDQVARYLIVIDSHNDGTVHTLPCPRCYARDEVQPLVMSMVNAEPREAWCEHCGSVFDFEGRC
jgi:hypothetical protein